MGRIGLVRSESFLVEAHVQVMVGWNMEDHPVARSRVAAVAHRAVARSHGAHTVSTLVVYDAEATILAAVCEES